MDFDDTHADYLRQWEQALATGDTSGVEAFMASGYHGWFCPGATESCAVLSSALVVEARKHDPGLGWLVHRELTEHGAAHTRAADLSP